MVRSPKYKVDNNIANIFVTTASEILDDRFLREGTQKNSFNIRSWILILMKSLIVLIKVKSQIRLHFLW